MRTPAAPRDTRNLPTCPGLIPGSVKARSEGEANACAGRLLCRAPRRGDAAPAPPGWALGRAGRGARLLARRRPPLLQDAGRRRRDLHPAPRHRARALGNDDVRGATGRRSLLALGIRSSGFLLSRHRVGRASARRDPARSIPWIASRLSGARNDKTSSATPSSYSGN